MIKLFIIFNGIAFVIYGISILFTGHMVEEFARYKLSQFRTLTGFLEFLGGLGCLIGLYFSDLIILSCSGLGLLMTLGIIVRFHLKDPFIEIVPAIGFACLNYFLVYQQFS